MQYDFFDPAMQHDLKENAALENNLCHAIAER
jgi:hypothetical protein